MLFMRPRFSGAARLVLVVAWIVVGGGLDEVPFAAAPHHGPPAFCSCAPSGASQFSPS